MGKLTHIGLGCLFLVALFAVGFWYFPVIQMNEKLRAQELVLAEKIEQQRRVNAHLVAQIEAIETDPRVVESLARQHLHYARPGEQVIRFHPPKRGR